MKVYFKILGNWSKLEWKSTFCANIQKYYLHNLAICHTILAQSYLRARFQCINIYGRTILFRLSDTRTFICFFSFFLFFSFSFVRFYFFLFAMCKTVTTTKSGFDYEVIRYSIHFWSFFVGSIFNCTRCLCNFDNYSMIKLSVFFCTRIFGHYT